MPKTWSIELTVVGLNFRWTREGRITLARSVPFKVALEREPDNEYDENAIKVVIASDFKLTKLRGKQLGYIRKNSAALIAPRFDAGTLEPVKLWVTEVDPFYGDAQMDARFRDKRPAKKKDLTSR